MWQYMKNYACSRSETCFSVQEEGRHATALHGQASKQRLLLATAPQTCPVLGHLIASYMKLIASILATRLAIFY
jgi:hypothetical protein